MTFCRRVKIELTSKEFSDCCALAHLYGILSYAKVFSKDEISLSALDKEVYLHIIKYFSISGIDTKKIEITRRDVTFYITVEDKRVIDRILLDFGYSGDEPNYRILNQNFQCEDCKAAFIAGCFLSGGTITEPSKSYHLEFSTHKYLFFTDFIELLNETGFNPKKTERKASTRIVYFKDSTQIEDFLTYIGAVSSSMELMNEKIYKGIINLVNRQSNCENANIDKIITSSESDRKIIEYIYKVAGKKYLPKELNEVAKLRLEHPELSLSDIGRLTDPILTKSGVSHRMRKIRSFASLLEANNDE